MSFVLDHVRHVDAQLDRLYYNYNYSLTSLYSQAPRGSNAEESPPPSPPWSARSWTGSGDSSARSGRDGIASREAGVGAIDGRDGFGAASGYSNSAQLVEIDRELSARIHKLQALVKGLSIDATTSSTATTTTATTATNGLLSPAQLGVGLRLANLQDRRCRACRQQQRQVQEQRPEHEEEQLRQRRRRRGGSRDEDMSVLERDPSSAANETMSAYEHELEWLMLSKVAAQTYGQVLGTILELTIPLSDDLWYWDDVLGSQTYAVLFMVQMSPVWAWDWARGIFADVEGRARARVRAGRLGNATWSEFGVLAREILTEKMSLVRGLSVQGTLAGLVSSVSMLSPVARIKNEARVKQDVLKKFRMLNANALGVLVGEALNQDCSTDSSQFSSTTQPTAEVVAALEQQRQKWKRTVAKSVALMAAVLQKVSDASVALDKFDDAIAALTNEDDFYVNSSATDDSADDDDGSTSSSLRPVLVAQRLQELLDVRLPAYVDYFQGVRSDNGRPSRMIRYWPAATTLLLSSSTIVRIFFKRKEQILNSIRELGVTTVDFWHNWIVAPIQNIIKTIRHDEGSELSLLSKESLEGDRASLERMVVDFAVDNPEIAGLREKSGSAVADATIASIRQKVREGDLTPVLRAYEQDLKRPVAGALTGNLIRTLLIQIQKTKVDVEVAVGGIDALLKSQELVFGFIGLTPGILICAGAWRWMKNVIGSRKVLERGNRQNQLLRLLRNIDRILSAATPTDFGELYYKDQGLLLCEVHVLQHSAREVLPTRIFREFLEDVDELVDVRSGLQRQEKAVQRVRWAYARWIT